MDNEVKHNAVMVRVEAYYDDDHNDVVLHLFVTYNGWLIYHTDNIYHYHYDMDGLSGYNLIGAIYYNPSKKPITLAYLYDKHLGGTDEEWRKFFEGIQNHVFNNVFPAKLKASDVIFMWASRVLKETNEGTYKEYNRNLIAKWEYSLEIPFSV